jgi:RHS repeat-associated protein
MTNIYSQLFVRRLSRIILGGIALLLWWLLSALTIQAQVTDFTQNTHGTNAMTMQVPLANYPGRGVNLPITLNYSTNGLWRVGYHGSYMSGGRTRAVTDALYAEHSTAGWTTSLNVPEIEWPKQNDVYWYTGKTYPFGTHYPYTYRIARVFIHMPDGSTHELRKSDAVYEDTGQIDTSGTFFAVDDSRMRYDSTGANTGSLYLADGTRYVLGTSTCQYIDRNGNTLTFDVTNQQWTDTMGRVIGMPWPANPSAGNYTYYLPGMAAPYTFKFETLGGPFVADYYLSGSGPTPTNQSPSLFHSIISDPTDPEADFSSDAYMISTQYGYGGFSPVVLTEIDLPNRQRYQFSYNSYGELQKVIYPTGGYQRYEYGIVTTIGGSESTYGQGTRGILSRWVSPNGTGGADEAQWQYSGTYNPRTVTAPDGSYTETYFFSAQVIQSNNFGYGDARNGMVYEERAYAAGGTMLRRSLTDYAQTSSTLTNPRPPNTVPSGSYTAYRNARPTKTVSLILDTGGGALAKTITYEYAPNGYEFTTGLDRTASTETYFATNVNQTTAQSGAIDLIPAGPTASRAVTTYINDSAYQTGNILGLPTSVVLIAGDGTPVSKSESFYDESDLQTYSDVDSGWTDPGRYRGNVTTGRRYLDASGEVPQGTECPVGVCLDTHADFDQVGNVWKVKNERGIESQIQFSLTYKHAFPTQTVSAAPDPSGGHGSNVPFTSSSTFDATTGMVLTTIDANGQVTTYSYQDDQGNPDPLNRLRKVTRPDGGWTKYSFGETVGTLYTMTETRQDSSRTVTSYQYLDPLGRVSRSFSNEGGGSFIAADTIYDFMGRVWKVSNPYRTTILNGVADINHTSDWTINSEFDALSRVKTVTLPDASTVHTDYVGIYTTVTDQAGRQRRQKTDALGRIVRVDEPDASGSLGTFDAPTQPSFYQYDTQGHLITLSQGLTSSGADPENPVSYIQHRYFKYDAFGRLTYEKQAEQAGTLTAADTLTGNGSWSRKLIYDESGYSGLLTTAIDARNISTHFYYDNLNRISQVTYSDSTPTVNNKYDQPVDTYFNKGHLTQAATAQGLTSGGDVLPATSQTYNYDLMGRVANNQQTVGDQSYIMSYGYNYGGAMTSETYPSGRIVTYAFDDGARLSQVSSGNTVYANQFDYSTTQGLLKSVTLGNSAVESYDYNSRLQLKSLDLSRSGTQIQHYDYKYGVYDPNANTLDETKNTGQIARIEGFITTTKQWQQNFEYDSLGRLKSGREFRGDNGGQSWLVSYSYDVFGNRYLQQSQNSGNPINQHWVESGDISPTTNRFTSSSVTYDDAGNITVDSRFRNLSLQYDANNRQKQSSDGTTTAVSVYDAAGQRVATQIGGALTNILVYDAGGKLLAEYGATVPIGGTQYVFADHQGSPRVITGASGVISRHDYAPFGEEIGSTIGMRNGTPGYGNGDNARQKYAGLESDDATGMDHTLWRQYDSLSGRWTAPDPYGGSMDALSPQSFNRYAYVNNDPINKIDPTGLMLSDIGVYQTDNPEAARLTERAEDQGVKNWVTRHQEQPHTTDHSSHFGGIGHASSEFENNHSVGGGALEHSGSDSNAGEHGDPQNSPGPRVIFDAVELLDDAAAGLPQGPLNKPNPINPIRSAKRNEVNPNDFKLDVDDPRVAVDGLIAFRVKFRIEYGELEEVNVSTTPNEKRRWRVAGTRQIDQNSFIFWANIWDGEASNNPIDVSVRIKWTADWKKTGKLNDIRHETVPATIRLLLGPKDR